MPKEQKNKIESTPVPAAPGVAAAVSVPASLEWQAPEFRFYEKSSRWFVISAVVAALLIILALVQGNFLFGVFVVIAELLVLFWSKAKPREVTFRVDAEGITMGNGKMRPWKSLLGYALMEELGGPQFYELIVRPAEPMSLYIRILVPNEKAEEVNAVVAQHLQPMEYEESLTEHISRWLGF